MKLKTSNSEVRLSLNKITKKLINNKMTDILKEKLAGYLLMKEFYYKHMIRQFLTVKDVDL